MNQRPIGFFDSGVGGLSVWREVVNLLPQESTLYFADQSFFPYGEKPATVIRQRMLQICCFLIKRKAKLIVIACNTATVSGIDRLRRQFKLPLIGVEPAIKSAVTLSQTGVIGILATKRTILSQRQRELTASFGRGKKFISLNGSHLTPLVEQGQANSLETRKVLKKLLLPLKKAQADVLVLASTHYVLLRKQIQACTGSGMTIIDSGLAVARQVKKVLQENKLISRRKKARHLFFTSGNLEKFQNFQDRKAIPILDRIYTCDPGNGFVEMVLW